MHPGTRIYQRRYQVVGVEFTSILCCHLPKLLLLQRMRTLRSKSSTKGRCRMLPGTRTSGQPTNKEALPRNISRTSRTQPLKIWITKRRYPQSTKEIAVAPWNKVQRALSTGKGNDYFNCGGSANSHTAPYATFDNRTTPTPNKTAGFQAPWDRDEVHYNRLPPRFLQCSHGRDDGPFNAPYATDRR